MTAVRRVVTGFLVVVAASGLAATEHAVAVTPCSRGTVALTFDDGPRGGSTARILDTLRSKRVPATFFVVGNRAAAYPALVRRQAAAGHVVANHSYNHEGLTGLSNAGIRSTIRRTNSRIVRAGAPKPRLVRPPYGLTNGRVRGVIAGLGMRQVLWTADSQDYRSTMSASDIASRVLARLRPGSNVLLHDGVRNSGSTAAAVPRIIDRARARGFCFGVLNSAGRVVAQRPRLTVANVGVTERRPGKAVFARFRVRLSAPTAHKVTVRFGTRKRTATPGADYKSRWGTLTFQPGQRVRTISVRVRGDALDESNETLALRLSRLNGARWGGRSSGRATIRDDDPRARVAVSGASVDEGPAGGARTVPFVVRLARPSGRTTAVAYTTVDGSARAGRDYRRATGRLVFRPGQTARTIRVAVIGNDLAQVDRAFSLKLVTPYRLVVSRATATGGILDDDPPATPDPEP